MRWWTYQKERFPIFAHGLLIVAFSACAVSFSTLLTGRAVPGWTTYAVAFVVCFLMFLQLRIADEWKDAEEDARWRPYRPVPRGLVSLKELRVVFVIAAVIQGLLAWWLDPHLLGVLAIAWAYLSLMSVEFFCRMWLKERPVIYLITHMGIMPLVDFFATACEWMPSHGAPPVGLGWFLAASFANGIVIELGRKLRQPQDEEEGVETYSRLWGMRGGLAVWFVALISTLGCALLASRAIGFFYPVAMVLGIALLIACGVGYSYLHSGASGKRVETFSGLWTLALYLMLGLIPLFVERGF